MPNKDENHKTEVNKKTKNEEGEWKNLTNQHLNNTQRRTTSVQRLKITVIRIGEKF